MFGFKFIREDEYFELKEQVRKLSYLVDERNTQIDELNKQIDSLKQSDVVLLTDTASEPLNVEKKTKKVVKKTEDAKKPRKVVRKAKDVK